MSHLALAAALALRALLPSSPAATTVVPASAPRVVTISAHDFAFTAPSSIPAGRTTFRLVNQGKELHHLTVIRLPAGKTQADYLKAMQAKGAPPAWAIEVGGPGAIVPGNSSDATMDLVPGRYLLACYVPSPGSPAPHMMKGMLKEFTVTGKGGGAAKAEPKGDVDIDLSDYAFTLSRPLTAGRHTIRVSNSGKQPHEVIIAKLPPGAKIGQLAAWVDGLMKGPPPGMPVGGMSPIAPGGTSSFTVALTPGRYGLICFLPDAKDGKPHTAHGMMQELTVAAK